MLKPFQFLLAIIRAVLMILLMISFIGIYLVYRIFKKHSDEFAFWLRRNYSRIGVKILNLNIEFIGEPVNDTPAIYVSNHRSFSDPVIISIFSEVFVIAKAEVASMPVINKAVEITGILYVKREDKSSRTSTRKLLVETIKKGRNVLIFAEGTVVKTKDILPLKYGSFIAAAKNDIAIVPIALEYKTKRDLWLKPSMLSQQISQFGKWRTDARITYGNPITHQDGETLHDLTEDWIRTNVVKLQENWSTAFEDGDL